MAWNLKNIEKELTLVSVACKLITDSRSWARLIILGHNPIWKGLEVRLFVALTQFQRAMGKPNFECEQISCVNEPSFAVFASDSWQVESAGIMHILDVFAACVCVSLMLLGCKC